MTFAEFKQTITANYNAVFPASACDISIGPLGKDSAYITYYLAGEQSEFPNRIALNDLFDITFCVFQDGVRYGDGVILDDNVEMPEALVLDVNHKSIKTAPENQYMAYGSISLPFRKTKGTPAKIIDTLKRYAEITKQTLTELYELEKLPTNQHPEVIEFVKGKLGLTESKDDEEYCDETNWAEEEASEADDRFEQRYMNGGNGFTASKKSENTQLQEDADITLNKDNKDLVEVGDILADGSNRYVVMNVIEYPRYKAITVRDEKDWRPIFADPLGNWYGTTLIRGPFIRKDGKVIKSESKQVNNMKIKYSKTYDKYQVITPDGRILEEFDTEKEAIDWASKQKDFVVKKEAVEYISQKELDDMPNDYKTTVGDTIKYSWEDTEMLRKKYKELGYEETDPMILARDDKYGTVLKPVKVKKDEDTGYDYWGPKEMEPFEGKAYIQYYGGPGALEYLVKARNGRYVWIDSSAGEPYFFNTYQDALKIQKEVGGEIMSAKEQGYDLNESMNGFNSNNAKAETLFDELKAAETFDANAWNNADSETREAMVRPIIVKFYKENRAAIDDNWDDFMELLEYWNYHTEYKIFRSLENDAILDEHKTIKKESIQSVANIFNKIRAVEKDIKETNGKLPYNFYEKTSEIEEDIARLADNEKAIVMDTYHQLNNLYSHYDKSDELELESKAKVTEDTVASENIAMTSPIKNTAHCDECLEDFEYEFDPKNEVSNDIEIHVKGNGYAYYAECPNCGNLIEVPAEELDLVVTNVDDITRDGFYMEVMDRHTARKCWYEVWRNGDDWEFDFNQIMFHLDMDTEVIAKMFQDELLDYADTVWGFISDIIEEEKLDDLDESKKLVDERAKKLRELKSRKASDDLE